MGTASTYNSGSNQSDLDPTKKKPLGTGTGNAGFDAVNKPDPATFGQNNLANRPVRPVGGSMAGGGVPTATGSKIGQSPMNPSPGYATRPGIGKTDFEAVNDPSKTPFGANSLANRPVRQVGRSMMDPQRQAEMARRRAVADAGTSDTGEDEETLPGRAKGGPVKAGKPYLVGEEGPEIIVPKQSGTVVPNHAISAAALKKAKACSHSRPRIFTPRQPPAEAYAHLRRHKASGASKQAPAAPSSRVDSAKRMANAPKGRLFEARKPPAYGGRHDH